jgi:hypothetical protein
VAIVTSFAPVENLKNAIPMYTRYAIVPRAKLPIIPNSSEIIDIGGLGKTRRSFYTSFFIL